MPVCLRHQAHDGNPLSRLRADEAVKIRDGFDAQREVAQGGADFGCLHGSRSRQARHLTLSHRHQQGEVVRDPVVRLRHIGCQLVVLFFEHNKTPIPFTLALGDGIGKKNVVRPMGYGR